MANVNIYDTANQLERDIRETDQYKALVEAYEAIQADEDANAVLGEFQELQQELFQKQQTGVEITEEDSLQAQNVSGKMSENELTMELMFMAIYTSVIRHLNMIPVYCIHVLMIYLLPIVCIL